jgi:hypothetical protein
MIATCANTRAWAGRRTIPLLSAPLVPAVAIWAQRPMSALCARRPARHSAEVWRTPSWRSRFRGQAYHLPQELQARIIAYPPPTLPRPPHHFITTPPPQPPPPAAVGPQKSFSKQEHPPPPNAHLPLQTTQHKPRQRGRHHCHARWWVVSFLPSSP